MVLTLARAPEPVRLIPDDLAWVMAGRDPSAEGLEPVLDPGRARRTVVLDEAPPALLEEGHGRPAHEHGGGHDHEDGGHDHEDMMAITGDPSADGLVMEPLEFSIGPLGSPLPAGIVADVQLDGDVVAKCRLRATLRAPQTTEVPAPPDMLARVSWSVAMLAATEAEAALTVSAPEALLRIAAVEVERATSHVAWLRALGRVLGWGVLVRRSSAALQPLMAARGALTLERLGGTDRAAVERLLAEAEATITGALGPCSRSRLLAARLHGRGVVADDAPLDGPNRRACGAALDSRSSDPLYRELGFEPTVRVGCDALARTVVRFEEAEASVRLAGEALRRHDDPLDRPHPAAGAVVEGPRGALRAQRTSGGWRLAVPAEQVTLDVAGHAVVGLEWGTALAVLVSFDLSPWKVGA